MQRVYFGLGTNLGQRRENLQQATTALTKVVTVTAVSHLYETPPWGVLEQPAFINMAAAGRTSLPPHELLRAIKQIEQDIGRQKTIKWGPRLIDIDILLYGDLVLKTEGLQIPHPYMQERPFVLGPLADIAADVVHPVFGKTVAELFAGIDDGSLTRLPDEIRLEPPAK